MDAYIRRHRRRLPGMENRHDAVLIGNGFGAPWRSLSRWRIRTYFQLVLSDAAAAFPDEGKKQFAVMASKVAEGGPRGHCRDRGQAACSRPPISPPHPELIDERKRVLMGIDPKAFQHACKILQEADLEPMLHR